MWLVGCLSEVSGNKSGGEGHDHIQGIGLGFGSGGSPQRESGERFDHKRARFCSLTHQWAWTSTPRELYGYVYDTVARGVLRPRVGREGHREGMDIAQ